MLATGRIYKGWHGRLGSVREGGGPMRLADEYTYGGLVVVLPLILVVKMVLFEPFYRGVPGLYLHAAAILLPFAILLRWPGVVAHLILPDPLKKAFCARMYGRLGGWTPPTTLH